MSDTEAVDLAGLRAVAEAATPGPWEDRTHGDYPWVALYDDEDKIPEGESLPSFEPGGSVTAADAAHIATFDPPTVLALLARVEAAEAKVARCERLAGQMEDDDAAPAETLAVVADDALVQFWRARDEYLFPSERETIRAALRLLRGQS